VFEDVARPGQAGARRVAGVQTHPDRNRGTEDLRVATEKGRQERPRRHREREAEGVDPLLDGGALGTQPAAHRSGDVGVRGVLPAKRAEGSRRRDAGSALVGSDDSRE
jgi:hypothetical protein